MSLDALFGSEITDEVKELARRRLLDGGNLARRRDLKRSMVKLVLLMVREINPLEHLSREETAILMGVNKQTVTNMEEQKRFVHVVNH